MQIQLSYRDNLACVTRHVSFDTHGTLRTAARLSANDLKHDTERARQGLDATIRCIRKLIGAPILVVRTSSHYCPDSVESQTRFTLVRGFTSLAL